MLQQTTVEAVRPRYEAFVARFPDAASLVEASEDDVLAAWSGLGYYQRARNLRATAAILVRESGGLLPESAADLARLPGIGRYTAGAISSIAFGRSEAILDGNVIRLLARIFRVAGDVRSSAVRDRLWQLARELVPARDPSAFNQGLMELGALVCRPQEPRCDECPLADDCGARLEESADRYPERRAPGAYSDVVVAAAIATDSAKRVLLVRRDARGAMRGLWELPSAEVRATDGARRIAQRIRAATGLDLTLGSVIATARHTVMKRRIVLRAFESSLAGDTSACARECAWVAPDKLAALPHSSLVEKTLRALNPRTKAPARRTPRRAR
jgi:A/G-specific adenine glycosylase